MKTFLCNALTLLVLFMIHVTDAYGTDLPSDTNFAPGKKVVLIINKENSYEIDFPARPYVVDDLVNLIPGEAIFIEARVQGKKLVKLKQVEKISNPEKTIEIQFKQNQDRASPFMVLSVKSPFQHPLKYVAKIQILGQQEFSKTDTLPVAPRLVSYESWPEPVTRILLGNFELIN